MKFNILNIAFFFNDAAGLVKYLTKYQPTLLIVDWCWSSNCDLALALRSRAVFSEMIVKHDLKNISQNPNVSLGDKQVEVLDKAQVETFKHFILVGGSGSGKTILGAEIAKIKIARLTEKSEVSRA